MAASSAQTAAPTTQTRIDINGWMNKSFQLFIFCCFFFYSVLFTFVSDNVSAESGVNWEELYVTAGHML